MLNVGVHQTSAIGAATRSASVCEIGDDLQAYFKLFSAVVDDPTEYQYRGQAAANISYSILNTSTWGLMSEIYNKKGDC